MEGIARRRPYSTGRGTRLHPAPCLLTGAQHQGPRAAVVLFLPPLQAQRCGWGLGLAGHRCGQVAACLRAARSDLCVGGPTLRCSLWIDGRSSSRCCLRRSPAAASMCARMHSALRVARQRGCASGARFAPRAWARPDPTRTLAWRACMHAGLLRCAFPHAVADAADAGMSAALQDQAAAEAEVAFMNVLMGEGGSCTMDAWMPCPSWHFDSWHLDSWHLDSWGMGRGAWVRVPAAPIGFHSSEANSTSHTHPGCNAVQCSVWGGEERQAPFASPKPTSRAVWENTGRMPD